MVVCLTWIIYVFAFTRLKAITAVPVNAPEFGKQIPSMGIQYTSHYHQRFDPSDRKQQHASSKEPAGLTGRLASEAAYKNRFTTNRNTRSPTRLNNGPAYYRLPQPDRRQSPKPVTLVFNISGQNFSLNGSLSLRINDGPRKGAFRNSFQPQEKLEILFTYAVRGIANVTVNLDTSTASIFQSKQRCMPRKPIVSTVNDTSNCEDSRYKQYFQQPDNDLPMSPQQETRDSGGSNSWNIDENTSWDASPDAVVTDGREKSTIVHRLSTDCPAQTQTVTRFWSCLNAEVAPCFMISASSELYRISERICPKNILETTRDFERLF